MSAEPRGWSEYPEAMMRGQAFHAAAERIGESVVTGVWQRFGVEMGLTPPGATLEEVADALSRAAALGSRDWAWPPRPAGVAPSGRPEPVRAAFCRFLETGEPYYREESR